MRADVQVVFGNTHVAKTPPLAGFVEFPAEIGKP